MWFQAAGKPRKRATKRYPLQRSCNQLEPLEQRRLLTSGDSTSSSDTVTDPVQAAMIALQGPDRQGKDGPLARLSFDLNLLFQENQIHSRLHPHETFVPSNSLLQVSQGRVSVDVVAKGNPAQFATQLAALDMQVTTQAGGQLSGTIPIDRLDDITTLTEFNFAKPIYRPITRAGSVTSQGDVSMRADLARTSFGVDGTGIKVGVLSDSINRVTYPGGVDGVQRDISTGDLPAGVQILEDGLPGDTDEGRAMAQLVHDVAPGASIAYATAEGGEAHFGDNIRRLADAGARVIVDDIGYFAEPYFQDGFISRAIDEVTARGVTYFSAAGNSADTSYESAFVPSNQTGMFGGPMHDFDPGPGVETFQEITVPLGQGMPIGLQWDQPFTSLGGPGPTNDLDIYVYGSDRTTLLAISATDNPGADPIEIAAFGNSGFDFDNNGIPDTKFYVRIELFRGEPAGLMKYIAFTNGGGTQIVGFPTNSGTAYGHSVARGTVGVGAAAFFLTPAFGASTPSLNAFSSLGGVPILFDTSGNRLATPRLTAPAVTGPDHGNTTFFPNGFDVTQDDDSFPNFPGTSAAAPHVAAVAALMLQAAGGPSSLTPLQIRNALQDTAIDITTRTETSPGGGTTDIANGVGFDNYSGYGLVNALAALQVALGSVSINDVTAFEGTGGQRNFMFTVSVVGNVKTPIVVNYVTVAGTASADDFVAANGAVTFEPTGSRTQLVTIQVNGDSAVEPDETFFVDLTSETAFVADSRGVGTILNDDVSVTIADASALEPDTGTVNTVFTVSIQGNNHRTLSIPYFTADNNAKVLADYLSRSGVLNIALNQSTATITVPVVGDKLDEDDETYFVTLLDIPQGRNVALGRILDDDALPAMYTSDVQIDTTKPDTIQASFAVALGAVSGRAVSVRYRTADGGAIASQDYSPVEGTIVFAPGEINKLVTVDVLGSELGPNHNFFLRLSNPVNALLADGNGEGTIVYADAPEFEATIDDQEPGFVQSRFGWSSATNLAAYHLDYTTHAPGSADDTATWSFENLADGTYQVFAHWMPYFAWATDAPYAVFDDASLLDTIEVDQTLLPADDWAHGKAWHSLGSFNIANGRLVVQLGANANGAVIADAIRIVAGGVISAAEINVAGFGLSIANGDQSPLFDDSTHFGSVAATTNSAIRTFTITNTGNAPLQLAATPVSIEGRDPQDFTVLQQPAGTIAPGASSTFQVMFHPTALDGRLARVSIASNDGSEDPYTFDIAGTGAAVGAAELLADDTAANFTRNGNWVGQANAFSSGGQSLSHASGQGSSLANWTFNSLAPGHYRVYTTWVPFANRATNAPFSVSDGSTALATVLVNQQQGPSGATQGGVTWESLGTFDVYSGALKVVLSNQANGMVVADAVKIVRDDLPALAPSASAQASPLHNSAAPLDVNNDGRVSTLDALVVVNYIINPGSSSPVASPLAASGSSARSAAATRYMDTNGDGRVTTLDALRVVNYLLSGGGSGVAKPAAAPAAQPLAASSAAVDAAIMFVAADKPSSSATSPSAVGATTASVASAAKAAPATSLMEADPVDEVFKSCSHAGSLFDGDDALESEDAELALL